MQVPWLTIGDLGPVQVPSAKMRPPLVRPAKGGMHMEKPTIGEPFGAGATVGAGTKVGATVASGTVQTATARTPIILIKWSARDLITGRFVFIVGARGIRGRETLAVARQLFNPTRGMQLPR